MVLFAATHLYWGLGGTAGLPSGFSLFSNTALVIVNFVAIPLCFAGAALALALVRPWGRRSPRVILLVAAWGTTTLLVVHAAPAVIEWVGLGLGLRSTDLSPAERFSLFLYEPYWLLGGILFGLAAWSYQRGSLNQDGAG